MADATLMPAAWQPRRTADERIERLVEAWFAERVAAGYSRDSMVTRRKHVRRAAEHLDLLACDPAALGAWVGSHDWSPSTARTVSAAVRGFADWLVEHHHRPPFADASADPAGDELLLRQWATWLQACGRGPGTVRLRLYHVRRFAKGRRLLDADRDEVAEWLAGLSDREPETLKSAQSSLRGFYKWAYRHGHSPDDPTDLLAPVRVPSAPDLTRCAPDEALRSALLACSSDADRAMLLLAAHAGLRRAEIASVHSRDLHGEVLTVTGKGRRKRRVPLGPDLAAMVRRADGWLLPSPARPGQPVTADWVGRRVSLLLPGGWTAHSLRHRYATRAYKGTRALFAVQRLLGHANVQTTRRYVDSDDDAIAAAAAAGRGDDPAPPQPAARPALRLIDGQGGAA
jgi:integrase